MLWPSVAIVLALSLEGALMFGHRWMKAAALSETAQQHALSGQASALTQEVIPSCATDVRYAQSLPAAVSIDKLVQSLQDSTKAFGVTLQSVASEPHTATARTLAYVQVDFSLQGAYAAIKPALGEALSRYPFAVVTRFRLKRTSIAPLAEDANVQMLLPIRPQVLEVNCRLDPATVPPSGAPSHPEAKASRAP
jgi:hypothetical protein